MLIGTAVVGATCLIFAIIEVLQKTFPGKVEAGLSILNPLFLLGLVTGGAIIYWFTGASTQARITSYNVCYTKLLRA